MDSRKMITKKRIFFIGLFVLLVLIANQINFSKVIGSDKQYFTFFQFFGPIAGAFLGPVFGAVSVLGAQLIEFTASGKAFDFINLFRLAPMIFAAYYFGKFGVKSLKGALIPIVPLICMALFILHPIGGQVWYYSLYWLIPLIAFLFFKKRLFARSLGATFTAHAIGSTVWLYTIPMAASQWQMLIPIVAYERILFAAGISVSFIAFNSVLAKLERLLPSEIISIDARYVLFKTAKIKA
ncbi:MAG: hypothetical protein AB1467_03135 [Candidatus Diapherotrites archaeon]